MFKQILLSVSVIAGLTAMSANAQECEKNYNILSVQGKAKDWAVVREYVRIMLKDNCTSTGPNMYIYGVSSYEDLLKNTSDEVAKEAIVDTILMLYNLRIEMIPANAKMGDEGDIRSRLVDAWVRNRKDSVESIFNETLKAILLSKEESKANVVAYYMLYSSRMKELGKLDCDSIISTYDLLSGYNELNMEKFKDDSTKLAGYVKAQSFVDEYAGSCLTCGTLMEIYNKQFDERKTDLKWLKKAGLSISRKKCALDSVTKSDPVIFKILEAIVQLDPEVSPSLVKEYVKSLMQQGRCADAVPYVEKLIASESEAKTQAEYYMLLAGCYSESGKYSDARAAAKKAAELRPNWGKPWMFVGQLYAASAKACSSEDPCEARAVFWAAVDKYNYAKSVDPNCVDEANGLINQAAAQYPTAGDCFFKGYSAGQSYTIGCWIGETTTIRTK